MDHGPVIFVSHTPSDSYRVEPWMVAMMQGGVKLAFRDNIEAADRALRSARLLVAFVSSAATESGPAPHDLALAQASRKPVVIVLLDDTDVSECSGNCQVIDVCKLGRRAAWSALVAAINARGANWRDPEALPWWKQPRRNVKGSVMRARRWALAAAAVWVGLLIAYFGFGLMRPVEKLPPKAEPVPTAQTPVAPVAPADPAPPPPPNSAAAILGAIIAPQSAPTASVPAAPPPGPAVSDETLAIQHIRSCVAAGNRKQLMSDKQIESIVKTYFAERSKMQDTGNRDFNGIKAFITVNQLQWPEWEETIDSISITSRPAPDTFVVRVESHVLCSNPSTFSASSMGLTTDYTVQFVSPHSPLIIEVYGQPARSR